MRVIVHSDDGTMLEVEEVGASLHIRAEDHSTKVVLERITTLDEYKLFTQFRMVSEALTRGIRPQLDAQIARLRQPRSQ